MSTMIVKVRTVEAVLPHPNADRLEIALVGGWKSICRKGELQEGQKVVFFPPDSILPPALADDPPAGRLGVAKYCSLLPKNEQGLRPPGYRVKAARLRGQPSFGLVMALDPSRGDLDWPVDTDVAEFYGIEKWEPPLKCEAGDSAPEHPWFPKYTDIEHYANYPTAIADGEEVVITEKIHGTNARCGLVLAAAEDGAPQWTWMAGSHERPQETVLPPHGPPGRRRSLPERLYPEQRRPGGAGHQQGGHVLEGRRASGPRTKYANCSLPCRSIRTATRRRRSRSTGCFLTTACRKR